MCKRVSMCWGGGGCVCVRVRGYTHLVCVFVCVCFLCVVCCAHARVYVCASVRVFLCELSSLGCKRVLTLPITSFNLYLQGHDNETQARSYFGDPSLEGKEKLAEGALNSV